MMEQALGHSSAPPRKQQQRSLVTQQKLLDAATAAFAECGFEGTSTRDIADRAGVHHPLITYHFKNKEQLWRAAADRLFRDFNDTLFRVMEGAEADPKVSAEALVRTYVQYAYRYPALHKIILHESSHDSERLDWLAKTYLKPVVQMCSGHIEKLQELGVAPEGNPALLCNMIRVTAGGLLALSLEVKATSNIDFDDEGELEKLTQTIVRCFLSGTPKTNGASLNGG